MSDKIVYTVERNDELYHYGVKGMKWGVRRTAEQLGRTLKKAGASIKRSVSESNRRSEQRRRERELQRMKGKPKRLTTEELQARINRLKLEKEYKSLLSESRSKGRKAVEDVLMDIGKNTAKNLGTQSCVYAIGTMINKLAGKDIVNPKKGRKDK